MHRSGTGSVDNVSICVTKNEGKICILGGRLTVLNDNKLDYCQRKRKRLKQKNWLPKTE